LVLNKHHAMKKYGAVGGIAPLFPDLCTRWVIWSASSPNRFISFEAAASIIWVGGWVGLRTGLDVVAKTETCVSAGNRTPVVHTVVGQKLESANPAPCGQHTGPNYLY
jgi:hypothetical protein